MAASLLVLGLVGVWGLGLFVAGCLLGLLRVPTHSVRRPVWAEILGLGLVLGLGATAWLLFLWSLVGGPLGQLSSLAINAAGITGGVFTIGRVRKHNVENPPANWGNQNAWVTAAQVAIAVLFLATLAQTLVTPQRFWDERATFALRGAVLNEDHSVWSADLLDVDFVVYHPRYPLLIPLLEQHIYSLSGERNDRWAKAIFPLMFLGIVLTFAGVLLRSRSPGAAWLWALVMATVPALSPHDYGFSCGQADAPMACFHGVSVLYLWEGLRLLGRESPDTPSCFRAFGVAGILAALGAFTKDEGLAFAMLDLLLLGCLTVLVWLLKSGSRSVNGMVTPTTKTLGVKGVCVFAAALLLAIGPWLAYRRYLPMTTEMNYVGRLSIEGLSTRIGEIGWFAQHMIHRMFFEVTEWGCTWWLMLASGILAWRRVIKTPQLFLIGDIAGAIAALLVAGLLAPTAIVEHIGGSSHRFLMQLMPTGILFAAAVLTPDDALAQSQSGRA